MKRYRARPIDMSLADYCGVEAENINIEYIEDPNGDMVFYKDIIKLIGHEIVRYKNMAKYAAWADSPFEVMALAELLKKIEGKNNEKITKESSQQTTEADSTKYKS